MRLASACLCGVRCRYNGESEDRAEVIRLVRDGEALPVCPEQIGGLSTPREPAEIVGGDGHDVLSGKARVVTRDGRDVTAEFLRGAAEVLRLARETRAVEVLLKSRSPSCGHGVINRGGQTVIGDGVTAALLAKEGIRVRCID